MVTQALVLNVLAAVIGWLVSRKTEMSKFEFDIARKLLNVVGLDPLNNTKSSLIHRFIPILCYAITAVSGLSEFFVHYRGMESCTRVSQWLLPQSELILTTTVFIVYKNKIKDLMVKSEQFWNLSDFGSEFVDHLVEPHDALRRIIPVYRLGTIVACLGFIVVNGFFFGRRPIDLTWNETTTRIPSPIFECLFVIHSIVVTSCYYVIAAGDILFYTLVSRIYTELEMVKLAFSDCEIKSLGSGMKRFKIAIKRHIFVLRFAEEFNGIWSICLMFQNTVNLFNICFNLMVISQNGLPPKFYILVNALPVLAIFSFQLYCYNYAGQILMDKSLEVPTAIFYKNWLKDDTYRDLHSILICIQRGSLEVKLTLGPFGIAKLDNFKIVVQKAFSFFTFLNTINRQN